MYGSKNANQYEGDCILQQGDIIYIGRLVPGYSRTANDLPVEQQPVWQIERISISEEQPAEPSNNNEGNTLYYTKRMYPNGNINYIFCMSQADTYNYEYRH